MLCLFFKKLFSSLNFLADSKKQGLVVCVFFVVVCFLPESPVQGAPVLVWRSFPSMFVGEVNPKTGLHPLCSHPGRDICMTRHTEVVDSR